LTGILEEAKSMVVGQEDWLRATGLIGLQAAACGLQPD
jgi:hypothetical protein